MLNTVPGVRVSTPYTLGATILILLVPSIGLVGPDTQKPVYMKY